LKQIFLYCGLMAAMAGLVFFFYYQKGQFNNVYSEVHNRLEEPTGNIQKPDSGNWYLNKWTLYHTLSFDGVNTLVIDNHIDTIFRYKYTLHADTLWVTTDNKHSIPNKIKLHNDQELVFESFLDEKKELRYTRTKNLNK
jgi:hypothetical protein